MNANDTYKLLSAFIDAVGYDIEIDKTIPGELIFSVSKRKKERSSKQIQDNDEFTEFYNNYKKKVCRPLALKEFLKLTKSERILMLNDYKTRFKYTEKYLVPKPHNYIKNREFMDERIERSGKKSNGENVKSKLQKKYLMHLVTDI